MQLLGVSFFYFTISKALCVCIVLYLLFFFSFSGNFVIVDAFPKLLIKRLKKIKTKDNGNTTANINKIASIKYPKRSSSSSPSFQIYESSVVTYACIHKNNTSIFDNFITKSNRNDYYLLQLYERCIILSSQTKT